jgi:hypothetical protein
VDSLKIAVAERGVKAANTIRANGSFLASGGPEGVACKQRHPTPRVASRTHLATGWPASL